MYQNSYDDTNFDNTNTDDFSIKVANHRQLTKMILSSRLTELLPQLIDYKNMPSSISKIQLEQLLRFENRNVIIGALKNGDISIIGWANAISYNFYNYPLVNGITFILPKELLLKKEEYIQSTPYQKGNFVVVRNKFNNNFINDSQIIDYYTSHLSEIKATRYSLSIQAKAITYFKGVDVSQNNSLNSIINKFFNGSPVLKVENAFDVGDMVGQVSSAQTIPSLLSATKEEYNNIFNEMLNMLGILNLGVDKQSGVNMYESQVNRSFLESVSNIYIKSRQDSFDLINRDFNKKIIVVYDDEMEEEIRNDKTLSIDGNNKKEDKPINNINKLNNKKANFKGGKK